MAFKMKGPMFYKSVLKNYNKMSKYSTDAVKFGEDEEDSAYKQAEYVKDMRLDPADNPANAPQSALAKKESTMTQEEYNKAREDMLNRGMSPVEVDDALKGIKIVKKKKK